MTSTDRVWFITGAGRGIGRALADAALRPANSVVATVRDPGGLDDVVGGSTRQLCTSRSSTCATATVCAAPSTGASSASDVSTSSSTTPATASSAPSRSCPSDDARAIIDTNLFGAIWTTQAVLPHLRRQGEGHIVQISTVGAVGAMPTFGLYNASKWALEGFSEALAGEVARFGLRVTIAELGGFATDWAGRSLQFAPPDPAYDSLREDLFGTSAVPWPAADDTEPTDEPAAIAAAAIRTLVDAPDGPRRVARRRRRSAPRSGRPRCPPHRLRARSPLRLADGRRDRRPPRGLTERRSWDCSRWRCGRGGHLRLTSSTP